MDDRDRVGPERSEQGSLNPCYSVCWQDQQHHIPWELAWLVEPQAPGQTPWM